MKPNKPIMTMPLTVEEREVSQATLDYYSSEFGEAWNALNKLMQEQKWH